MLLQSTEQVLRMSLANESTPNWYYEKKDLRKTPSVADGIPFETELRYRRESASFILKIGKQMNLSCNTSATGVVYMHRFYMCHSFKTFSRFVTACSCLFLAGKVEETPKKCKDIIRVAKSFMTDAQFNTFGEDPKETVMIMERILLQTINFDLQVDHPYRHLINYFKNLKHDKEEMHIFAQTAWNLANDSLCTTVCLQWEPEIIAIAAMFLASKICKSRVAEEIATTQWWEMYVENVTVEILEDVCHQILDLYTNEHNSKDSPPQTQNPAVDQQQLHQMTPSLTPVTAAASGTIVPVTTANQI